MEIFLSKFMRKETFLFTQERTVCLTCALVTTESFCSGLQLYCVKKIVCEGVVVLLSETTVSLKVLLGILSSLFCCYFLNKNN